MSRILFTSSPGLGHVHPMVPLAAALARRGHDVRWAVAPSVRPRLEAAGFGTFTAGIEVGVRHAEYRRRYPDAGLLPPELRPDHMFPALFGEISPPPMLADLRRLSEGWPPALIVHDASELAGPIVAALNGVAQVTHGFGALVPETRMRAAAAAVAPLWNQHGLPAAPYGGAYDHLYLDIYPPSLRPEGNGHVAQVQALRPVAFDAVAGDYAGPATRVCRPAGRPLVYVTFGTLFNDVDGDFAAAVAGVATLAVDVLVTVGPGGDPARLGPMPANVQVERYVPQTDLLPDTAVVVSHGGSGTFLASLGLGKAQLCLPQAADQFVNARQGAAAGAALVLAPGERSGGAVAVAVGRLLDEPGFTRAARGVATEMATMPAPDEVAVLLEQLL